MDNAPFNPTSLDGFVFGQDWPRVNVATLSGLHMASCAKARQLKTASMVTTATRSLMADSAWQEVHGTGCFWKATCMVSNAAFVGVGE
jgi:hypothetical protein